jgi:hypothetical protein
MKLHKLLIGAVAIGCAALSHAESDLNTGAAPGLSAAAKLDFRVVVPRIIFLRVGTGVNFADALGALNTDRVDFALTAADVGSATAVAGAAGLGPYPVAVRVLGNGGNISFYRCWHPKWPDPHHHPSADRAVDPSHPHQLQRSWPAPSRHWQRRGRCGHQLACHRQHRQPIGQLELCLQQL